MQLKQISPYCYEIPQSGSMNVPGRVFMSERMASALSEEEALKQVANVATLPGILTAAMAMPDMHWGYGFPIGGVAAFDWDTGVISPGGVGYDINCGVRLAGTGLEKKEILPAVERLVTALFQNIPSGVGSTGSVKLSVKEEMRVLREGGRWAVRQGLGEPSDVERTEDGGCMAEADPSVISERALMRGTRQLGTLGSGNHFLEVGVVDEIFDERAARAFGLFPDQVTVLLHSGSRGLGYQVCDDSLAFMARHVRTLDIQLPDRQLACAMIRSEAGRRYFAAMACAANYAWANRQILLHRARETFQQVLGIGPRDLAMHQVYDICHNIAKREEHTVDGKKRIVCVHRKGATRAFPPGHPAVCEAYRQTGQPILIPGDMGTASYVMAGTRTAMAQSFGSTCHGAGRVLSRKAAKKRSRGRAIHRELADKGILVKWTGRSTLAEEMPEAYKDIDQVVDAVHGAGLSKKVARLRPVCVIKG
ncbi:RNA-splicing ligase RtcB [Desulfosarcina alkanivorans]|uniref:tRNA-splicing ligase RtcB n=1 Tax=Desulfosarcina alkanivorans TaxID=571177 RepID=A0A5K7YS77_9BACT|nr:RtcB family protein [Desulfosarcina alkanivorans]BBO71023.1 RNA-splicing ligase RtcB [Desulfosarcina alkanivorans]